MKIKNYIWLVLIIGFTGSQAAAQRTPSKPTQNLSASERATAIDTSIATTCAETAPAAPRILTHDSAVYSTERIASTLNGVWIGRVSGEYDKQLFAGDGFLNVGYFMIVDVSRGESFVLQEFGPTRPGASFRAEPGAPTWTYVWCARQNYQSASPRQVHQFVKVSDNVEDARQLITTATGLSLPPDRIVLSNVWQSLVEARFFDDPNRSLAYAGALFKPVTMGTVTSAGGGNLFELRLVGEYRGFGQTAAKFVVGEPIHNVEQAHFLGITENGGNFLVASVGMGNAMMGPKADALAAVFSTQMTFDKVVIGLGSNIGITPSPSPSPSPSASPTPAATSPAKGAVTAPVKAGSSGRAKAGNKQRKAHSTP